jgi:hypothetical protein
VCVLLCFPLFVSPFRANEENKRAQPARDGLNVTVATR